MTKVPAQFSDRNVCVLGLGYVGLPLAVILANAGFDVIGVDRQQSIVDQLQAGVPHVFEPGLREKLVQVVHSGKLCLHQRVPRDCQSTVFIVTVGTPLGADGLVISDMISDVAREIGSVATTGSMVIVRSTVKVGATRNVVLPILRRSGKDFDLAFCPERILAGSAMRELLALPQIVGGDSLAAAFRAANFFQLLTPTVVQVSSLETAEMIKLIDNASRDVQFGFANEVGKLCDALAISAREVVEAGKLGYSRTNLFMPGPVGGPCLSKDTYILAESVHDFGVAPEIALAARRINESQPREVISDVVSHVRQNPKFPAKPVICILGIAFKGRPDTDDTRGTMAIPIRAELGRLFPGIDVRAYDPVVSALRIKELGYDPAETLVEALVGANLVLIHTNHLKIAGMPLENLASSLGVPCFIFDFWNLFSAQDLQLPAHVGYGALGSWQQTMFAGKTTVYTPT